MTSELCNQVALTSKMLNDTIPNIKPQIPQTYKFTINIRDILINIHIVNVKYNIFNCKICLVYINQNCISLHLDPEINYYHWTLTFYPGSQYNNLSLMFPLPYKIPKQRNGKDTLFLCDQCILHVHSN